MKRHDLQEHFCNQVYLIYNKAIYYKNTKQCGGAIQTRRLHIAMKWDR